MKIPEINAMFAQQTGMTLAQMTPAQRREAMHSRGMDNKEFYQELEMSSPYVDTHEDISETLDVIGLHSHTFWEILYVRSGSLQYLIGTGRYRIRRGDIIFLPPGLAHRPLFLEQLSEPFIRSVLWINADFYRTLQKRFPELQLENKHLLRTAGTRWESLGDVFRVGVTEAQRMEPMWQAACAGNTMQLLVWCSRAFRDIDDTTSLPEKRELIDEMILYIENHLAEPLSLDTIARQFLISKSTVGQLFRRRLNVSFYHFVTRRRLITAKNLILEGVPFERVAEQVGFGDYSGFYRAFRQEYNISPAHFRAMMQTPPPPPLTDPNP